MSEEGVSGGESDGTNRSDGSDGAEWTEEIGEGSGRVSGEEIACRGLGAEAVSTRASGSKEQRRKRKRAARRAESGGGASDELSAARTMREASSAQEGRCSEASQRVRSADAERIAAIRSEISGRESQRLKASGVVLLSRAMESSD